MVKFCVLSNTELVSHLVSRNSTEAIYVEGLEITLEALFTPSQQASLKGVWGRLGMIPVI